jgi:transposase InsO family protein
MYKENMPWKVSGVLEQRTRFVFDYQTGLYTMAELCRVYEISRPTGYKWVERRQQDGMEGLKDRSRAPERHPNQTSRKVEEQILELRRKHPSWGAKKLKGHLEWKWGGRRWPAASTIGELLKREGLTVAQPKKRRTPPYTQPLEAAEEPNHVWCADFKGWFRTRDGERIDPLTMTDHCSRYLLRCQAVEKTDFPQVQGIFQATFREYGMPWAIRTDNGSPFATRAIAGLSRLSIYLIKLGIRTERIEAGHPEQNGRHERMHRTLKKETATPPKKNRREQQRAFDEFREEYNHERPHEALDQQPPSAFYQSSARVYPERIPELEYPSGMQVRRIQKHGEFKWKGRSIFLTEALAGEPVGLEAVDERYWRVYLAACPIGLFDAHESCVQRLSPEEK